MPGDEILLTLFISCEISVLLRLYGKFLYLKLTFRSQISDANLFFEPPQSNIISKLSTDYNKTVRLRLLGWAVRPVRVCSQTGQSYHLLIFMSSLQMQRRQRVGFVPRKHFPDERTNEYPDNMQIPQHCSPLYHRTYRRSMLLG